MFIYLNIVHTIIICIIITTVLIILIIIIIFVIIKYLYNCICAFVVAN